jgi:hypothetical protein
MEYKSAYRPIHEYNTENLKQENMQCTIVLVHLIYDPDVIMSKAGSRWHQQH